MKAIMISIKPKYVADILNGIKTIEIRKTMPKCELPIDVYIYCTKGTQLIKYTDEYIATDFYKGLEFQKTTPKAMNGKVVAKFTLNKIEKFDRYDTIRTTKISSTCLTLDGLLNYAGEKSIYFWHISNLEIFDEPRELSEFRKVMSEYNHWLLCADCPRYWEDESGTPIEPRCELNWKDCDKDRLTKAPQSWCYVEV